MDKEKIKYIFNFYKEFYLSLWKPIKTILLIALIWIYGSIGLMFILFDVKEQSRANIDVDMIGWFFLLSAFIFMVNLLHLIENKKND